MLDDVENEIERLTGELFVSYYIPSSDDQSHECVRNYITPFSTPMKLQPRIIEPIEPIGRLNFADGQFVMDLQTNF